MNDFGRLFNVSIFGESHGECVGVLLDGVPAGISLDPLDFKEDLLRRNPAKKGTTARKEKDAPIINSGIFNGKTTGAPLLILFENKDKRSKDYSKTKNIPRPGHADLTAFIKYNGFNDYRGGGHFSGRLTASIVAAGVIAKKILNKVSIKAKLIEAGGSENIENAVSLAIKNNDSIGGIVECRINNINAGLGEPFFDSAESLLSHLLFSIPGIKGVEFGLGFSCTKMRGSEFNDVILDKSGLTKTNNSGGINGGITNCNEMIFRVAVRPTPTIGITQQSINILTNKKSELSVTGRHDVCFALRIPVVIEAVASIVIADLTLINNANMSKN